MDRRIRWVIVTCCVAVFVVAAPWLVLYSLGYRLSHGKLEQTGLILLSSNPAGASVWIDGAPTGQRTPTAITRRAPGRYIVTVRLEGFREWVKPVNLAPQEVERFEQIRFLPQTIERTRVLRQGVQTFALSADGKLAVFADTDSPNGLFMKHLIEEEEPVLATRLNGSIVKIVLAHNNRAALVTTNSENGAETFWVSLREPYTTMRLDEWISGAVTYRLNPKAAHQVFALAEGRLCRVDVKEKSVKWDIATEVETFEVTEEHLWLLRLNSASVVMRPLNSTEPLDEKEAFTLAKVNGWDSLPRRLMADVGRNIAVALPTPTLLLRGSPESNELSAVISGGRDVVFSPNRLLAAVVTEKDVRVVTAHPVSWLPTDTRRSFGRPAQSVCELTSEHKEKCQVFWLSDSAHLLVKHGQQLEMVEIDGGNRQLVLDGIPSDTMLAFDPQEEIIYWISQDDTEPGRQFLFAARLRPQSKGILDWLSKRRTPSSSSTLNRP